MFTTERSEYVPTSDDRFQCHDGSVEVCAVHHMATGHLWPWSTGSVAKIYTSCAKIYTSCGRQCIVFTDLYFYIECVLK
jgi:hypothetical protein